MSTLIFYSVWNGLDGALMSHIDISMCVTWARWGHLCHTWMRHFAPVVWQVLDGALLKGVFSLGKTYCSLE